MLNKRDRAINVFSLFKIRKRSPLNKSKNYLLPITYYLLPITYYLLLLPITYYLLPITYYLLPITYYLLPITYYLLPITYYFRAAVLNLSLTSIYISFS